MEESAPIDWKSNASPLTYRGAVYDIGGANPIAQRVRPVALNYQEKMSDLIKGFLSFIDIRLLTSPWSPPLVVIIKYKVENIRLWID